MLQHVSRRDDVAPLQWGCLRRNLWSQSTNKLIPMQPTPAVLLPRMWMGSYSVSRKPRRADVRVAVPKGCIHPSCVLWVQTIANHVMYHAHVVFMHFFGLQRDIDMLIFVLYHIWSMIHSDIVIQRTCDASSLCRYCCDNDALKNFWTKSCNKKRRSRKTSARRRVAKDPLQPCKVSVYILNDQITWSESHRRQISWRQKVRFGVGRRNRFLVSWYFQCVIFFCSRGVR